MTIARFIAQRPLCMTWKRPEQSFKDLKLTIRDTTLLDREMLRNRKVGPIKRMAILHETKWAKIRAAAKFNTDIKRAYFFLAIFLGTFFFWGVWNALQQFSITRKGLD